MHRLANKRFGRLVALRICGKQRQHNLWECKCDCGKIHNVRSTHLTDGRIMSCGCLHRERASMSMFKHGMSETPEFRVWTRMRSRCLDKNCKSYKDYGGRGIKICVRWDAFANFFSDMGVRPSPGHSIERIENNLGYSPINCRWATKLEQARNKRNNRFITVNGVRRCMGEWAEVTGLSPSVIGNRIYSGWSEQEAVTLPLHANHRL